MTGCGAMTRRVLFAWLPILLLGVGSCGPGDTALAVRVDSTLAADDSVGSVRLTVNSSERVVTLSGRVESQDIRRRAVRLARQTEGVADVIDRMVVQTRVQQPVAVPSSRAPKMGHAGEEH